MTIDFDSQPIREIRKGRSLAWDPYAISLEQDAADWLTLNDDEKDLLLGQTFGFLIGEREVTHDLAPLQMALRFEKGRIEEEMYLTQQMYEESTHVEFFERWIMEALPGKLGVDVPYPNGAPSPFLLKTLPGKMQALLTDPSPKAQLKAVVAYHAIVEGVLAEIGYEIFYACIDDRGIFPGLREGVRNIQQDEARHIAFGTYLARRIISENPELAKTFEEEMESHYDATVESPARYLAQRKQPRPFDLDPERFRKIGKSMYRRRLNAVLKGGLVEA